VIAQGRVEVGLWSGEASGSSLAFRPEGRLDRFMLHPTRRQSLAASREGREIEL